MSKFIVQSPLVNNNPFFQVIMDNFLGIVNKYHKNGMQARRSLEAIYGMLL